MSTEDVCCSHPVLLLSLALLLRQVPENTHMCTHTHLERGVSSPTHRLGLGGRQAGRQVRVGACECACGSITYVYARVCASPRPVFVVEAGEGVQLGYLPQVLGQLEQLSVTVSVQVGLHEWPNLNPATKHGSEDYKSQVTHGRDLTPKINKKHLYKICWIYNQD